MKEVIKLVKSSKDIVLNKSYVDAQKEKGVSDYVTLVDIKVQEHIFNGLRTLFPDHQFFGEESEQQKLDFNRPVWILDPLDGTTNLIHSYPQVAVSLAFWNEGRIEFGVVYNPYTDELFTASIGKGSFLNGEPIQVSDHKSLADCLVSIGTSPYHKDDSEAFFRISHKLFLECQDIRRSGSAALDMAYVASGRTDAFFEMSLAPWDYAAGYIIVKEAGGMVTTMDNESLSFKKRSSVFATNGKMHPVILEYFKSIPK